MTSLDAPNVAENLPTHWIGVWERVNIGVFLLWVAVLSICLMRLEGDARYPAQDRRMKKAGVIGSEKGNAHAAP
jgi:hypothetical protein